MKKNITLCKWYCKSCGMYSNGRPNSTCCPYCNSKRVERISESVVII